MTKDINKAMFFTIIFENILLVLLGTAGYFYFQYRAGVFIIPPTIKEIGRVILMFSMLIGMIGSWIGFVFFAIIICSAIEVYNEKKDGLLNDSSNDLE